MTNQNDIRRRIDVVMLIIILAGVGTAYFTGKNSAWEDGELNTIRGAATLPEGCFHPIQ